jgi:hypothetical protein
MSTPDRTDLYRSQLGRRESAQLADVLERVLDKGIVIAGDIQINLLDIELLTIKLRLLVASADKAREMGIDWWQGDPFLKGGSRNGGLEDRLKRLEQKAGLDVDKND